MSGMTQAWATFNASAADYWIADYCKRCESLFYSHATQNADPEDTGKAYRLCPWCKGKCSAAEQDHHNAMVEASKVKR